MNDTDHPAALVEIETETRTVQANGWVETGDYHTATFAGRQPDDVRGCPTGRSQVSLAAAIADLASRTNLESGTAYTPADFVTIRHRAAL